MKNLEVNYTLAPRNPSTMEQSLKTLRETGFDGNVTVFAEPWSYFKKDIFDNVRIIFNERKLGCFKNFDRVLEWSNAEYLLYLQDDFILRDGIMEEIDRIIESKEDFGYYNFFLSRLNLDSVKKLGWNEFTRGYELCGACFLFKKSSIKKIINHPFYINHKNTKDKNLDACIWETCKQLWLPWYIPSESYAIHIWESTIWHKDIAINKIIKKEFN